MKCSLFSAIIQNGLFYKSLISIFVCIFLDVENESFAKKIHDICIWLFQQMDSTEDIWYVYYLWTLF